MRFWSQKTKIVLVLTAMVPLTVPTGSRAEEPAAPVAATSNPDSEARDCGKLLWSVVDVLGRQQISSPSRQVMLSSIHQVLTGRQPSDNDPNFERMQSCQTGEEFAEVFLSAWKASAWN